MDRSRLEAFSDGVSFAGLFWWAIRHEHMKIPFTPEGARRAAIRFGIGNIFEQTPAQKTPAQKTPAGGEGGGTS